MEVACTPEKIETLRKFFIQQGVEVCDSHLNSCIDQAIHEGNETDNRKLAKRLRKHFIRLLLAWWKGAHYVFSPDTRQFHKRTLLQLIEGNGKLFECPAFVHAIHIDATNVQSRKDNIRVWFEYKEGYGFLDEDDAAKKATVTVQSLSTSASGTQTTALKRRREEDQGQCKN